MTVITDISRLYGVDTWGVSRRSGAQMQQACCICNAWLAIGDDGLIADYGTMDCNTPPAGGDRIDARGGIVIPAFCDSHTHLVYAGSRHGEFEDKIRGLSYEEIAARGGGILNSADLLHATSEDELYRQSAARLSEVISKGTGAVEIKSGYGLTVGDELKMLRVIARLAESHPVDVRATFLGAHAVGRAYAGRQQAYIDHLIADMLPAVAAEGLADYVDVFCDRGFFTVEQTDAILTAADHYGLKPKIHANELDCSGGVQIGVVHNALSVDHLERIGVDEVELLAASTTVATMLPGASFFLGMPYAPARRAVDAGVTVALASDYNPGSSPSGDMRFVWALGCIKMRLTPIEALHAVTINGAAAMGLGTTHGSLDRGRTANLLISRPLDDLAQIPYQYTTPWIAMHLHHGRPV